MIYAVGYVVFAGDRARSIDYYIIALPWFELYQIFNYRGNNGKALILVGLIRLDGQKFPPIQPTNFRV
jgi:hypothetical protein